MQMMHWLRPKSLTGLMLLGLAVIAAPFVFGIISAALQIRALAATGQKIVVDGVAATRDSQQLFSEINALERAARVYDQLDKTKLLDKYGAVDEQLSKTRQLLLEKAAPDVHQTLDELGREQVSLHQFVLSMPPGTGTQGGSLAARFETIGTLVNRVAEQSSAQIERELHGLDEKTGRARQQLYWEAGLLIPLIAGAIVVLTVFVGRPLRKLDRAISELGEGNFSHPITVLGPLPVDIQSLGKQLEWLRQRLLEIAQERNKFLRHMSHELKTPLANIVQGAELLMEGAVGELDTNQREVMNILRDNGSKLQRMIENLLQYSAWQTSKVGLDPSEFQLLKLVKQVIENQQITILSKRIRLEVRLEDVTILADRGKIRLIFENLVSNAIKYSPKGGTIHLRARRVDTQVVIDVADNGPGIPIEDRPHIFEAFFTSRGTSTRTGLKVKGTGIGLSVVLEFVSAHKGTIQIIDGEFPGAHFRITMPINAESSDSATGAEKARAHAA
jgi:two-component system sensor histidine kinase GlrK